MTHHSLTKNLSIHRIISCVGHSFFLHEMPIRVFVFIRLIKKELILHIVQNLLFLKNMAVLFSEH
jgi:hypothetical protein